MATPLSLTGRCVSCDLSLKSGERTNIKYDLVKIDGKFSHQALRDAISKVQVDVNGFLTVQVEKEKQESALLKNSGVKPNAKSGSARAAGAGGDDAAAEGDETAGDDSDDMGLEDDEDDEDQDVPNKTGHVNQTSKREAQDLNSASNKKSKLLDS